MKEIKNNSMIEKIIKNSRFIALAYKIDNDFILKNSLINIKRNYPNATHYCYAYKNITTGAFSDDGEPKGSAGLAIYDVIKKNDLDKILIVIIRYYGGIKFGASNLFRAYLNMASKVIKSCEIVNLTTLYKIDATFSYDNENKILNFIKLKNIKIDNIIKNEYITIRIKNINKNIFDEIKYLFKEISYYD